MSIVALTGFTALRKNLENLGEVKNQGGSVKLRDISWKIKALSENIEKIFTLFFELMIL